MSEISKIIEEFGGVSETAKRLGISPSAVSQWKRKGIPKGWRMALEHMRKAAETKDTAPEPSDKNAGQELPTATDKGPAILIDPLK